MAISTDTSVYVSGITTYTIDSISDTEFKVSYPVGAGHTYTRMINRSGDAAEDESRLDSHLLSVNHKVLVGTISTVAYPNPE
tara:strand:+ start:382 stop:627 length:246 start_codon:yes stop_codon:yes gene_type:complete